MEGEPEDRYIVNIADFTLMYDIVRHTSGLCEHITRDSNPITKTLIRRCIRDGRALADVLALEVQELICAALGLDPGEVINPAAEARALHALITSEITRSRFGGDLRPDEEAEPLDEANRQIRKFTESAREPRTALEDLIARYVEVAPRHA